MKKTKDRRSNNEGTIYKRKDGRWCAQLTIGYKEEDGKPIRKTMYGYTQKEALIKLKRESVNLMTDNNQRKNIYKDTKFHDIYMDWLLVFKKVTVSGQTFEGYLSRAQKYILTIGDLLIYDIQPVDIQRVLNRLSEDNRSPDTIRKVKNDFNQFFKYTVDEGILKTNPVDRVKISKSKRKEYNETEYSAIPIDQRFKILEALENEPVLKPMVLIMMYAGLRCGEMLALKWRHIDFGRAIITVECAVSRSCKIDEQGNIVSRESTITNTKTDCSNRKLEIGPLLLGTLKNWYQYQQMLEEKEKRKLTGDNDLVFPTRDGKLRTYSSFRTLLRRFHEKHGFSGIHPHTYRHTFASMLSENNVNPRTIQLLMGHRDIKTTLGIYTSISNQQLSAAVNSIEYSFIKNKEEKQEK